MIKPFIVNSQEINLQTCLGSKFFDILMSEVELGTTTTVNSNLIYDYIQPMLVQWTFYYVLPHIHIKSTNQGLIKQSNTTNSDAADLEETAAMKAGIRDLAEFYTTRLINELEINSALYPDYDICTEEDQNVKPNQNGYFTGIYINKNK